MSAQFVKNLASLPGLLWLCLLLCPLVAGAQITNVWTYPSADSFVRALDPTSNFGKAGALAVSGALARNDIGDTNGEYDSFIRFPTDGLKKALNAALGSNNWKLTGVELRLSEDSDPDNPIFNRGVGAFEIRWVSSTNWVEGSGTPKSNRTTGITYQQVPALLDPLKDVSLGQFTNSGADLHLAFTLPLADALVTNILAGRALNFYLAPVTPTIGFTFYSRNFPNGLYRAAFDVTAVAILPFIQHIVPVSSNQLAISFSVSSNMTCQLESSLSFASSSSWTPIFTAAPAPTNRDLTIFDTVTNSQLFYRLLSRP